MRIGTPLQRIIREIWRRTRVVGALPERYVPQMQVLQQHKPATRTA